MALRTFVGLGIGGMAVPFDILAEFMPSHLRGKALMGIEFFWTIGTLFVNGLAWAILEHSSWRWFVGLCSIPVVLAMFSFPLMPESPHWLLVVGRKKEAADVLRTAAILNGRPAAIGADTEIVLYHDDSDTVYGSDSESNSGQRAERSSLLGPKLKRTTLTLWLIWGSTGDRQPHSCVCACCL